MKDIGDALDNVIERMAHELMFRPTVDRLKCIVVIYAPYDGAYYQRYDYYSIERTPEHDRDFGFPFKSYAMRTDGTFELVASWLGCWRYDPLRHIRMACVNQFAPHC